MYLSILRKDLKRKKTMNIILLLFIILASMFFSSSMNNLVSITTAMKSYFDKAQLKDLIIVTMEDKENDNAITNFLNRDSNVKNWSVDENLYITDNYIKRKDRKKFELSSSSMISRFDLNQQKFFNSNDKEITYIKDGGIYMPNKMMENNHLKAGDIITISEGDYKKNFTIVDSCKDAFLGSTLMGVQRFIISSHDYKEMKDNTRFECGKIYSISSSKLQKLEKDYNQKGFNVIISCDRKLISFTYIMDMMIAGLLLIVSVCLILISMVILRFTIVFTLNEEFREIGIMKAIGIRDRKIRGLYIVKYLAISIIGSFIGFFISIPFAGMFIKQVSKNVMISSSKGPLINLFCSVLIVLIVIGFCYTCTHHVNQFSPVDAIRNGSNGERFKKKGILRLSRSRLSTILFMSWNDILSEPKKFVVLVLTFTLGIILIIEPLNAINTLKSDKLVTMFGMAQSDVYLTNENKQNKFMLEGRDYEKVYLSQIKQKLQDNNIPANVFCEMIFKFSIELKNKKYTSFSLQGTGTTADQYEYMMGQPPEYENEVALTRITADKIGAQIGDTVKIKTKDSYEDYIVTAFYQSMNNMGEGIRFSEKENLNYKYSFGCSAIQIKYNDNPSKKEIKNRFDEIKRVFPDFNVYTGGGYINEFTGNIADRLDGVKKIIVAVIMIINMLVAVLMVKTFLIKEKGEIGMLKSIGFRNRSIISWQVLRIGIIMLISTVLAIIISNPVGQITIGKIFGMMGASHIEFAINPLEVYVIYPLLVFLIAMVASVITASQIIRISAQETNNIE
jgi:putative ABC transport system permease protein